VLDNAAVESFNSTIKVDYIHRHRFVTRTEARFKIATWSSTSSTHDHATVQPAACRPTEFERVINEARNNQDPKHLAA
jgi:putative transposase